MVSILQLDCNIFFKMPINKTLNEFLATLSLPRDLLEDTISKLHAEGVSLTQLISDITDEELEEIGIEEVPRIAIKQGIIKHKENEVCGYICNI